MIWTGATIGGKTPIHATAALAGTFSKLYDARRASGLWVKNFSRGADAGSIDTIFG